jgi:hypothetical protein
MLNVDVRVLGDGAVAILPDRLRGLGFEVRTEASTFNDHPEVWPPRPIGAVRLFCRKAGYTVLVVCITPGDLEQGLTDLLIPASCWYLWPPWRRRWFAMVHEVLGCLEREGARWPGDG